MIWIVIHTHIISEILFSRYISYLFLILPLAVVILLWILIHLILGQNIRDVVDYQVTSTFFISSTTLYFGYCSLDIHWISNFSNLALSVFMLNKIYVTGTNINLIFFRYLFSSDRFVFHSSSAFWFANTRSETFVFCPNNLI